MNVGLAGFMVIGGLRLLAVAGAVTRCERRRFGVTVPFAGAKEGEAEAETNQQDNSWVPIH